MATSIHRFLTMDTMQPADPNSFPTALLTCEPDHCFVRVFYHGNRKVSKDVSHCKSAQIIHVLDRMTLPTF